MPIPAIDQKVVLSRLREYLSREGSLQRVTEHCGVDPHTTRSWVNGTHCPKGLLLIKLWTYLTVAGIDAPELDPEDRVVDYLVMLVGFGLLSTNEAAHVFGQSTVQKAYRILFGERTPQIVRESRDILVGIYDEALRNAMASVPKLPIKKSQMVPDGAVNPDSDREKEREVTLPSRCSSNGQTNAVVLSTLLHAALPLARLFNSDSTKPQDRAHLRNLMGETGMFELSNLINALCSERARQQGR